VLQPAGGKDLEQAAKAGDNTIQFESSRTPLRSLCNATLVGTGEF